MEIAVGLRVVRGPDWKWGDQDGGEGSLGTVVETGEDTAYGQAVVVLWDNGMRANYRCGVDGSYDLKVYDSAPTGSCHRVICDTCRQKNFPGIRWKCSVCPDFDLCTPCYYAGKHSLEHRFQRIDSGSDGRSERVMPRKTSKRITVKGLFPNAKVVRGRDWIWGDQDGGKDKLGIIKNLKGNSEKNERNVVEVEWVESHIKNIYRAGHNGKVDVKCAVSAVGGYFYPEHLPLLGAPTQGQGTTSVPVSSPPIFATSTSLVPGDRVRVQLEMEIVKMMQEGHGGWNDQMKEILSEVGTIQSVLDSGDIRVRYPNGHIWTMNPDSVSRVELFSTGDPIRILDDIAKVHQLQENHGGWVDDMALSLGQLGRVVRVFPTGDVRVVVNGRTWTFNPSCLVPAPGENVPEVPAMVGSPSGEPDDMGVQLQLLSLLENPAVIVAAAASGDVATLKDYLSKHPRDVNAKAAGKAAVHCAAVSGNISMLKAIMEFNPDLEIEDEDGDRPLHLCAYSDEDEAAKLLLDRGAKVNSTNKKGATPLIIAAVKGHYSVLRILANHRQIKLHEQDSDGDTALHCAVLAQKNESVSILLDAGADPTLLNFRLFTPVHEAARIGFLPAIEHFVRKNQSLVNITKDDGYTPLHLASLNDHLDVVTALSEMEFCHISGVTKTRQSALHLAVHQGHTRIVERLVGFGIDLNLRDEDGDTALHVALSRRSADALSMETPQLKKVRESFGVPGDTGPHATATVACFLVQEGANLLLTNNKGHTPLQVCSPEVVSLVMTFKDSLAHKTRDKFHGSLRAPPPPAVTQIKAVHMLEMGGEGVPDVPFGSQPRKVMKMMTQPHAYVSRDGPSPPDRQTSLPVGSTSNSPDLELCFLCESPVDVKLEPCGHAIMCSTCARRAKKCPKQGCKAAVTGITKLKLMCPMCNEEEATVTLRPCGHQFCPGCARRMKRCFDCRMEITFKEGLPTLTSSLSIGGSGGVNCAICLTEPKNTALLCGHQLCWDCAQKVDHCPVCRKFITHRIRLFQ